MRIPFYPRSGHDRGTPILQNCVGQLFRNAQNAAVDVVFDILKKERVTLITLTINNHENIDIDMYVTEKWWTFVNGMTTTWSVSLKGYTRLFLSPWNTFFSSVKKTKANMCVEKMIIFSSWHTNSSSALIKRREMLWTVCYLHSCHPYDTRNNIWHTLYTLQALLTHHQ